MYKVGILLVAVFAAVTAVPWIPEPRPEETWMNQHYAFVNRTIESGGTIPIIFYGDSITRGWNSALWNQHYAPLGAVNYGIGGDRTEHVMWRIINGEVQGLSPDLVVLKIGTNNIGSSSDDIVRGIEAVVATLQEHLPTTPILLLSVLPRNNNNVERWQRIQDLNIKISKMDNGDGRVRFLSMFNEFSNGWLQIDPVLYSTDELHLAQPGYVKWQQTMDELFTEMLANSRKLRM